MSEEKSKWEIVENLAANPEVPTQKEITKSLTIDKEMVRSPEGIIAKFKERLIERKACIKLLQTWYDAQLEVGKYQLEKAVQLKKKETDIEVEKIFSDLNSKHLNHLREIGISNFEQKLAAVDKLNSMMTESLTKFQNADWPEFMKNETIKKIIDSYRAFFNKITEEFGD
jgi:hypothetical protein